MPSLLDRFKGCLIGHAVGDGLGAPFEGLTSELILAGHGRAADIVAHPPVETLYCTDDTHMSLGVAEVLCDAGTADEEKLMGAFSRNYDPRRGYGPGMRRLLEAAVLGEDWNALATNLFEGGSYGNGGAMRAAPVGLFFHADLARVWEEAGRQAAVTHRHPLGIEGAQIFAMAVALAARGEAGDKDAFYGELYRRATQDEYQWLLRTAWRLTERDSLALLGSSLEAHRSVVTAIACFAIAPDSYENTIARALALGDDTDTLMGMAGAISGAHLGIGAVSERLVGMLEEGVRGKDQIQNAAVALHAKLADNERH
ncbi:MAG TPA: ADP-ribosylglycohydrolase family protein [Phycisphaerae bacterium]|nr:ADP-ribosylglycohydrolase family protein [Phycisphaerae bacterium]